MLILFYKVFKNANTKNFNGFDNTLYEKIFLIKLADVVKVNQFLSWKHAKSQNPSVLSYF